MRLTRVYSPAALADRRELTLSGPSARRLTTVLRLQAGAELTLFDDSGFEYPARIVAIARDRVELRFDAGVAANREAPFAIELIQGISRGERMDFVVQKATELGMSRLLPAFTAHGQVRLDAARAAKRRTHWQEIATSACEQSARTRRPVIEAPAPLADCLAAVRATRRLVLDPGSGRTLAALPPPAAGVALLIGPEGGLSDDEMARVERDGFVAIGLGPRVLRTETAALAAIAAVQTRWGDFR